MSYILDQIGRVQLAIGDVNESVKELNAKLWSLNAEVLNLLNEATAEKEPEKKKIEIQSIHTCACGREYSV